MGYELYRQLANKTPRKAKPKKANAAKPVCIDLEQEDRNKSMLDGKHVELL
jgi:hypothetical protein